MAIHQHQMMTQLPVQLGKIITEQHQEMLVI